MKLYTHRVASTCVARRRKARRYHTGARGASIESFPMRVIILSVKSERDTARCRVSRTNTSPSCEKHSQASPTPFLHPSRLLHYTLIVGCVTRANRE